MAVPCFTKDPMVVSTRRGKCVTAFVTLGNGVTLATAFRWAKVYWTIYDEFVFVENDRFVLRFRPFPS